MRYLPRNRGRLFSAAAFTVVAAGALYLVNRPGGYAADSEPKATASSLDFVPADSVELFTVHLSELWKHPAGKAILAGAADGPPELVEEFRRQFGVDPEEMDRLTLFTPPFDPMGVNMDTVTAVTTRKPYDPKAVAAALTPNARERRRGARTVYVNERDAFRSLAFLDDRTYFLGLPDRLETFPRGEIAKEGVLAPVLAAAERHLVVAAADMDALSRISAKISRPVPTRVPPAPPEGPKPGAPDDATLHRLRFARLTVDLDDKLRAALQVTFATEADAKDGAADVEAARRLFRYRFEQIVGRFRLSAGAPKLMAILKDVQTAWRAAGAERKGAVVETDAEAAVDPTEASAALREALTVLGKELRFRKETKDLQQLALAVHAYNDSTGQLPPAAIYDKAGKPLLSWRVALLPYIGEGDLYNKEFHRDEPWDSDHNKDLLAKMPAIFAPPDSQAFKDHETHYQAVVGKGTVFEKPGLRIPFDIPDGLSNTILFVEAKKAVPWTKPEDVTLDDDKLLPKLGGLSKGGFKAALCDGSVRLFPLTMKEETLRIWATRNNNQVRPEPDK